MSGSPIPNVRRRKFPEGALFSTVTAADEGDTHNVAVAAAAAAAAEGRARRDRLVNSDRSGCCSLSSVTCPSTAQ